MASLSRTASRSDLLFAVYVELGSERSLALLHSRLVELGIKTSLSTLKRYSAKFDWPRRVAEVEAQAALRREGGHLKTALAIHDRQSQIARALQGAGGAALQQLIADAPRLREMKPADITRLLDLGMRTERDAAIGSTERRRLALAMANLITQEVVALFERINSITDEGSRARAFASGLDAIVDEHLRAEEAS
ncbi:MAG: hypothetical protein IT300_04495 [Dehalococcoidia bacterium]|nr:hypothetical protein [Dehalococcoidia bacterium]